ncbi:helix-turn-helix transcriptional regulator [Propionibacteriaceae bacterium Y1700]|uniref:helix-turn-helix transcriptional regulator n=1 Tax=Microlunatus sp. Y1700 TaxID=3418487 RepID=UPI003DA7354B
MDQDLTPTARALVALQVLQETPGITAERLSARLGVTERAARRYVATLRDAGIPIDSTRGRYGGYHVGRGMRPPPLTFSSAEALAVVMAVLDGHHEAGNPDDPVGSALGKILRCMPEAVAAQAEVVRRTAASAPDSWAVHPDPVITAQLVDACAGRRAVQLAYRSESGAEWTRAVDPWAVVVRHGRWYLLCRTRDKDTRRAYRIDRVRSVELTDTTFTPPKDLDPVAELEDHLAVGWEYAVEVTIEAPHDHLARYVPRSIGRLEPIDDHTTRLVGSTSNPYWYAEQLAAIAHPFMINSGDEVRRATRTLAERLLAASNDG